MTGRPRRAKYRPPKPIPRDVARPPHELNDPDLMLYAAKRLERAAEIIHREFCGGKPCHCRGRGTRRLAAALRIRTRNILTPPRPQVRFGDVAKQVVLPVKVG